MPNWSRKGNEWFPIDELPKKGPVLLADETQTIVWFSEDAKAEAVTHKEHQRDEQTLQFMHDKKGPIIKQRKLEPAFWSPVVVTD